MHDGDLLHKHRTNCVCPRDSLHTSAGDVLNISFGHGGLPTLHAGYWYAIVLNAELTGLEAKPKCMIRNSQVLLHVTSVVWMQAPKSRPSPQSKSALISHQPSAMRSQDIMRVCGFCAVWFTGKRSALVRRRLQLPQPWGLCWPVAKRPWNPLPCR